MFIPEEWTVIRHALDSVTIQGKDAKALVNIQNKVESELQTSTTKRDRELEKIKQKGNK